jgi:hypothetical protein
MRRKCIDCGFWFSRNQCRKCGQFLCGICADWPSPRLHSPGKGLCTACRTEKAPTEFTQEQSDYLLQRGSGTSLIINDPYNGKIEPSTLREWFERTYASRLSERSPE